AGESELLNRIHSTDADELMPPPKSGLKLSEAEKKLLGQWVTEGAKFTAHWSFVAPASPTIPKVTDATWCRNEIDYFIGHKLEGLKQKPSTAADRRSLIRRLSFDLTGLPPTAEEITAFVNDGSPKADENLIDRLLKSPRFGERQAVDWMDVSRYADTSGYQYDWPRTMHRWRAWVIDAFNMGLPYNLFIEWQIAGDLVPNANMAQIVATGFNRNNGFTIESGTIDEEYRVQYVTDRVTTMGTAFLGLTLECARCHDHKYDPISQKDFYSLFAFFNQVDEAGVVAGKPNFSAPAVSTPTPRQLARLQRISPQIAALTQELNRPDPQADQQQATWARTYRPIWRDARQSRFNLPENTLEHLAVVGPSSGAATGLRLELNPKAPDSQDGRFGLIDIKVWHRSGAVSNRVEITRLESARALGQDLSPILVDAQPGTPWLVPYNERTMVVAEFKQAAPPGGEFYVDVEIDTPAEVYLDLGVMLSSASKPLQLDRTGQLGEFVSRGSNPAEMRRAFRGNELPPYAKIFEQLIKLEGELDSLRAAVPMTMVMRDEKPRDTFVLERGAYDKPKEQVQPGTPLRLPPMPANAPPNRLGLAQWLTMPGNPLTARVAVNRFWQQLFGHGLVRTSEDFGGQGERPDHPELLDWLAVDFAKNGWNVKRLLKQICLSATYRQSSVVAGRDFEWDTDNRFLARYPRQRLSAEMVRDNALAVSGRLVESVGYDSVNPYQPNGLWEQLTNREDYQQKYATSKGDDLYRRSLYTYWKRASHHPVMAMFDAPSREVCTIRRPTTNTPLQALALLNETLFVETARSLAGRMLTDLRFGRTDEQRILHAFELATSRVPNRLEAYALRQLLNHERNSLSNDQVKRLLAVGESSNPNSVPEKELAAYTMVARAILNLSETISKP
ncbi:MAG: DUF1553 domain-containing protein, partial [Limisphaerales bacterium]